MTIECDALTRAGRVDVAQGTAAACHCGAKHREERGEERQPQSYNVIQMYSMFYSVDILILILIKFCMILKNSDVNMGGEHRG